MIRARSRTSGPRARRRRRLPTPTCRRQRSRRAAGDIEGDPASFEWRIIRADVLALVPFPRSTPSAMAHIVDDNLFLADLVHDQIIADRKAAELRMARRLTDIRGRCDPSGRVLE